MPAPHLENSSAPTRLIERWRHFIQIAGTRLRGRILITTAALILGIGTLDFGVGFEISLLLFYVIPVCLASTLGWRAGAVTSVLCVVAWLSGDLAAGARYSTPLIPIWNACAALGTYLVVVTVFSSLLGLQREMEKRVRQRTADLQEEIAERERLEKAILEIGERERHSVGRDLHDDLGQHLTATALAVQILGEELHSREAKEETEAWKIVELVEHAIEKTRRLSKGLLLAEIEPEGLATAIRELAATISAQFRVACEFEFSGEPPVGHEVATHLYRIAQEAVTNAVRHGKARTIAISLTTDPSGAVDLQVRDDGCGVPPPEKRGEGLGLRIMRHRSKMIGGSFTVEPAEGGGTLVVCRIAGRNDTHASA